MYHYDKRLDFHALGREIKRKREVKGWTQDYLAQLVDLSTPVIKCKKTPRKKCRFVAERRKKR